jgi:hypothetical protein
LRTGNVGPRFSGAPEQEDKLRHLLTYASRSWGLFGHQLPRLARLACLAILCACDNRELPVPTPQPVPQPARTPQPTATFEFQQMINRNYDILFVINSTVSMVPVQASLAANFPYFINVLENLPGGLPNVHIGVITSDMGAGAFTSSLPGCERPDNGSLVDKVRAATDPVCATAMLNPGQHFIISSKDGTENNFTGDMADVFRCIAQVGTTGCGFEQPLEAARAALGDLTGDPTHDIPIRPVPPSNAGFLRPDAYLVVIFITNEQECSSAPDSTLFDDTPGSDTTLGPLPARCFSHTDICDGQLVVNYVKQGLPAGPFETCTSDETTFATNPKLAPIPVQFYVDYFKSLKADPEKVFVSGIVAPPSPYSLVSLPDGNGGTFIGQGNSCMGAAGVFGRPTPRWTTFFGGFEANHVATTSVCDQSFVAALVNVAAMLGDDPPAPCISGTFLSVTGPNGPRPDCTVVNHAFDPSGNPVDMALHSCVDDGNQPPCWSLTPSGSGDCPGQQVVGFDLLPTQLPDFDITMTCALCAPTSAGCP